MARILIAWELGGGFGHVLPLTAVARALLAAGHEIFVAARDLPRVTAAMTGMPVHIMSAPYFPGLDAPAQQQCSLSDVIWFDGGGHTAAVLAAVYGAWRELYAGLAIDLLIADAAPMALAAAQGLTRSIGYDAFLHATDAAAWRMFRDWERADSVGSDERARQLLQHLNAARETAGLAPARDLAEGFAAQVQFLRQLPELDYAAPRTGVHYVTQALPAGAQVQWPQPQLPRRLFAYLSKSYASSDRVIHALARLQQTSVVCFHDGIAADRLRKAEHLSYATGFFDLETLLPMTDAVVCHGAGLQVRAVQHGKPVLALPMHTEQFLSARAAVRAGVALMHVATGERIDFLPLVRALLGTPALTESARRLGEAARTRDPDAATAITGAVERLLQSLKRTWPDL
jgi:UDP:flavonoid glycosyltransferase YjiC (YdhE family)